MTHAIKTTIPARLNTMIATAIVALFVGVSVTPSAMADNHANAAKASAFDAARKAELHMIKEGHILPATRVPVIKSTAPLKQAPKYAQGRAQDS